MSQSKTNLISPLYCEQPTQHMSPMNHTDTFEGKIKGNKLTGREVTVASRVKTLDDNIGQHLMCSKGLFNF